jgi:hypothetical protein
MDLPSSQVLEHYRRKEAIEKALEGVADHAGLKSPRAGHALATEGKLFCAFIALIVASEIGLKLGGLMAKRGWGQGELIRDLDKIRLVTAAGGQRLVSSLTRTQRGVLSAFDLDAEDLKAYVVKGAG